MAMLDVLKTAAKIAQEAGKIELYGELLGVHEKLLEQQGRIVTLEAENIELRKELGIKGNLRATQNVYWLDVDGEKNGPFCTCCWDDEKKLLRLHKSPVSESMHCPKCKTLVKRGYPQVQSHINHPLNQAI